MTRVLVVDDDDAIRETMTAALEDDGHEALTAVDGEPLDIAPCERPGLFSWISTCLGGRGPALPRLLPRARGMQVDRDSHSPGPRRHRGRGRAGPATTAVAGGAAAGAGLVGPLDHALAARALLVEHTPHRRLYKRCRSPSGAAAPCASHPVCT